MRSDEFCQSSTQQPFLLIFLGGVGILGTLSTVVAITVASVLVPDHDWIAETISDLAAGPMQVVTDAALYGFAAALVATAMAASHCHPGRAFWSVGVVSLAMLAAIVTVIAARDEYGDSDTVGITIHSELVYALGVLFLVAMLGMAHGAGAHNPRLRRTLVLLGLAWGVLSPAFFFVPNSIDGLYERGIGLIAGTFVVCLSWTFLRQGIAGLRCR